MTRRLLVLIPDRVSEWVAKGEVVERYFNPGNVFDHIDLLLTNDDHPDPMALATMAGQATIAVHNVPAPSWLFPVTAGWRPLLLRLWGRRVVAVARQLQPDLLRAHGVRVNLFAAALVRDALGVPLVVSLHGNPDIDEMRGRRATTLQQRLAGRLVESIERFGLHRADVALAVYEPILPYLERMGARRIELAYNAVGYGAQPKQSWAIDRTRVRAVCVARQWPDQKDPRPIINAVAQLPGVHLVLVGDGPLHAEVLDAVARTGASDRITTIEAMQNREVLALLAASDMFVYQSDNHEISKGCIEAALTGLPIIANDRGGAPAPELVGDHIRLVEGSAASYRDAIADLVADDRARAHLGRAALAYARQRWDPVAAEARVAAIYEALLARGRSATT